MREKLKEKSKLCELVMNITRSPDRAGELLTEVTMSTRLTQAEYTNEESFGILSSVIQAVFAESNPESIWFEGKPLELGNLRKEL